VTEHYLSERALARYTVSWHAVSMKSWEHDLACLRWHWGEAYEITRVLGVFRAVRRDDGAAVCAPTAKTLLREIGADYEARPVPRDPPAA
jgi:hypothetical protein